MKLDMLILDWLLTIGALSWINGFMGMTGWSLIKSLWILLMVTTKVAHSLTFIRSFIQYFKGIKKHCEIIAYNHFPKGSFLCVIILKWNILWLVSVHGLEIYSIKVDGPLKVDDILLSWFH